jgi:hypothetical protein
MTISGLVTLGLTMVTSPEVASQARVVLEEAEMVGVDPTDPPSRARVVLEEAETHGAMMHGVDLVDPAPSQARVVLEEAPIRGDPAPSQARVVLEEAPSQARVEPELMVGRPMDTSKILPSPRLRPRCPSAQKRLAPTEDGL